MSTATITQAQNDKPARSPLAAILGKIRDFAIELYAAHGGWFVHDAGQPSSVASARATDKSRRRMLALALDAETHSPALSAELRHFASKH